MYQNDCQDPRIKKRPFFIDFFTSRLKIGMANKSQNAKHLTVNTALNFIVDSTFMRDRWNLSTQKARYANFPFLSKYTNSTAWCVSIILFLDKYIFLCFSEKSPSNIRRGLYHLTIILFD